MPQPVRLVTYQSSLCCLTWGVAWGHAWWMPGHPVCTLKRITAILSKSKSLGETFGQVFNFFKVNFSILPLVHTCFQKVIYISIVLSKRSALKRKKKKKKKGEKRRREHTHTRTHTHCTPPPPPPPPRHPIHVEASVEVSFVHLPLYFPSLWCRAHEGRCSMWNHRKELCKDKYEWAS